MNTEKVIHQLRQEAQLQRDRFWRVILAAQLNEAADVMESLQAQLTASQDRERAMTKQRAGPTKEEV